MTQIPWPSVSEYPVVSAAYRVALITILMAHQRARERRVMRVGEAGVMGRVKGRQRLRWRHTHRGKAEMETHAQREGRDGDIRTEGRQRWRHTHREKTEMETYA